MHVDICMYTRTRTHARTHARAHAHTHAHTHPYIYTLTHVCLIIFYTHKDSGEQKKYTCD